jgi:DNA-binding protein YbaB
MRPEMEGRVQAILGSFRHQREELEATSEQLSRTTASAVSPDHMVRVTVAAEAGVTELVIDPRAMQTYQADALAATIVAATQDATAKLRDSLSERLRATLGDEVDLHALDNPVDTAAVIKRMARQLYGR